MESIGTRIKREREAQGIDRARLSKMSGVGYTTISELERGGMKTTTKLRVIADALNVSLEWLETGQGDKEKSEPSSQPAGLERSKIAAAVRISHYVRDAALEPMSDDRYVEVLAAAIQLVAENPDSEANLPQAAREVAARIRSQG